METRWLSERIDYDGSALRAHWIYQTTGIVGDAWIGFRGACEVVPSEMADLADLHGPGIRGADMVHLLGESFDRMDLEAAVLRQRLVTVLAAEVLRNQSPSAARLHRLGDDIYLDDRKLSISIATRSSVSTLWHFGVNITTEQVPVPAVGLTELGVTPQRFGRRLLAVLAAEWHSIRMARCKVRAKGEA